MLTRLTLIAASMFYIAVPAHAQSLSGSEIKNQIIGKNFNYRARGNRVGTIIYASNKTLRWRSTAGHSGIGEWRIEEDRMCTYFASAGNWRGLPWRCGTIRSRGQKYRFGSTTLWR